MKAITLEDQGADALRRQQMGNRLLANQRLQGLYQLRDYFIGQKSYGPNYHPSIDATLAELDAQIRALGG